MFIYHYLRLRSNVFKGFGNDEDFFFAWIVTLFKMMVLIARKASQYTLNISSDFPYSWAGIAAIYQTGFSMKLKIFSRTLKMTNFTFLFVL